MKILPILPATPISNIYFRTHTVHVSVSKLRDFVKPFCIRVDRISKEEIEKWKKKSKQAESDSGRITKLILLENTVVGPNKGMPLVI